MFARGVLFAGLFLLSTLALAMAACDGGDDVVITPPATVTESSTATSTVTATTTPSVTSTATATETTTVTPTPTASAPGAPAGYAESCAAGYPWGEAVSGPFVCIDAPESGITLGASVAVSGYAGGSFENNVVVELRDEANNPLVQSPLTYEAPELGAPGAWEVTLSVPSGRPAGSPGRIVAYFESPRDGGVVALASIEVRFP